MTEYITKKDAELVLRQLRKTYRRVDEKCAIDGCILEIREMDSVDAVSRGVLDQIRWERDIAIGQLESYGVSLGEKADVMKVVHGKWEEVGVADYKCSRCGFRFTSADPITMFQYCRCGAKMDGDGDG